MAYRFAFRVGEHMVRVGQLYRDTGTTTIRQLVLDGATAGGKDLPLIEYRTDGRVSLRIDPVVLIYTPAEWDAFCDGIQKGEFDHFATKAP